MDLGSSDGDGWLLDALATSPLFSAASTPSWPFGDQHSSSPMDAATAAPDEAPTSARSGRSESASTKLGNISGKFQVHVSLDADLSASPCFLKERLTLALRYFKESTDQHLLVQVWAPTKNGDRYMLTTSGQPFVLDQQSITLLQYRAVSMGYVFPVDVNNVHELGLPGRVYRQRIPEWTPNVQYYSSDEYRRLDHAISYNVHGTLALPVFHPSVQSCIAVVELIMTSKKVNYASEVDKVCKALEAVNLKSTDIVEHPYVQICNEGRQAALVEILEILTVVCEEFKLPLGQTWVPCKHQSILSHGGGVKKTCSSFDGSCMEEVCISTSDVAFHVIDASMWGFRDACVAHHLQKGQGVSGKAFSSRRPCFSKDVSRFSKMEYPLVHYARMFGLAGCFAICLQSTYTGDDYILEFFLPPDCREDNEQKALLESIIVLLIQNLRSLEVASDEGSDEAYLRVDAVTLLHNGETKNTYVHDLSFGGRAHALPESNTHGGIHESDNRNNKASTVSNKHLLSGNYSKCNDKPVAEPSGNGTSNSSLLYKNKKNPERRRGKPEKTFSLEVIQQYFSGSLKCAAKSLGVCPTTLKRICRQHGISNWPSRQIGKVNRSISRLQEVIEAAHGSESAFNVISIAPPRPVPVNLLDIEKARRNETAEHYNHFGEENKGPFSQNLQQSGCNLSALMSSRTFLASNGTHTEADKSIKSRSSSGQHSTHSQTSEGSIQGSLGNRASACKPIASTFIGPQKNLCNLEGFTAFEEQDLLLSRMVIKDSLRPTVIPPGRLILPRDSGIVTVKARYKEDILRFRFPCSGSVSALKDEVAKRIPVDVGNFEIKYLDDDHEWVNLTCEADLEECMEIYQLSGSSFMRLLVADIAFILGSSCGSTA